MWGKTAAEISVPPRHTTIQGSRGKTLLYLAGSLAFTAIGVLMVADPHRGLKSWLCVTFFGLCTAVFAVLLVRPHKLILDDNGFTLDGGLRRSPRTTAWRDVETFFVYRLPKAGKMIGYTLMPAVRKNTMMANLARNFGGDGALPKGWSMSPEQMAETLNAHRARALAARR
jgi:hypothetical protein